MTIFEDIFSFENLKLAFYRLKKNSTIDVKDFYGEIIFNYSLKDNLKNLNNKLINRTYTPNRPFKYFQPKPSKTQRTKTILSIEDSIVYLAITDYLARLCFNHFKKTEKFVFGNILSDDFIDGLKLLQQGSVNLEVFKPFKPLYNSFINSSQQEYEKNNQQFILETDITGFFDSISHGVLLTKLQKYNSNEEVLNLLIDCLNVWSGTREGITPYIGIPQGPIASFFYANLMLHDLDIQIIENGFAYYRYTDDIKLFGQTEKELNDGLTLIDSYLKSNGLSINSSKTEFHNLESYVSTEKWKRLKNHSLDIEIPPEIIENLDSEYAYQINSKEFLHMNIPEDEIINIIKGKINYIENNIIKEQEIENYELFEKDVLSNSFIWRFFNRFLREKYNTFIQPDEFVINQWIKNTELFYWRANHFCTNLSFCKLNEIQIKKLKQLSLKFERFEWIRYQILVALSNSIGFERKTQRGLFEEIKSEASPFVRLIQYSILINRLDKDDQLYISVIRRIRKDESNYIQQSIFQYILLHEKPKLDKWLTI